MVELSLNFEFPPEENFRYIPEMAKAPFVANEAFLNSVPLSVTNQDKYRSDFGRLVRNNPWLKQYVGNPTRKLVIGAAVVREDKLFDTGQFRDEPWHIDGYEFSDITLFASSTTTELAECQVDILDGRLTHTRQTDSGTWQQRKQNTFVTLALIAKALGSDWLEVAGGLADASEARVKQLKRRVRVHDLSILQLMPCVAVTGDKLTMLHRPSVWHKSQPTSRVIGRGFSGEVDDLSMVS